MNSLKLLVLALSVSALFADLLCTKSWKMVSTGRDHTLAIDQSGFLYAFGNNVFGQLGQGSGTSYSKAATPLAVMSGTTFKFVAAKNETSFAITTNGILYAWGRNDKSQLGLGSSGVPVLSPQRVGSSSNWIAVAPGAFHTLGLNSLGELYVWGSGSRGVLGIGGTSTSHSVPTQLWSNTTWRSISANEYQSFAITNAGQLYAWGDNDFGQIGDGTANDRFIPTYVSHPTGRSWKTVAAGMYHTLAIDSYNYLYSWGFNYYGQLGDSSYSRRNRPNQISTSDWKSITAGNYFSAGINSYGRLYTWGLNHKSQLGKSSPSERYSPEMVDDESKSWSSVSAGGAHVVAIISDRQDLISWGDNSAGQLGTGFYSSRSYVQYCTSSSGGSSNYTDSSYNSTYREYSYSSSSSGSSVGVVIIVLVVIIGICACVYGIVRSNQQKSQQQLASDNSTQLVSLSGRPSDVQPQFIAHQSKLGAGPGGLY